MTAALSNRVRADLRLALALDRDRELREDTIEARMVAVLEAREAARGGIDGAGFSYRQALVDLASWAGVLADELERPSSCPVNGDGR